MQRAYAAYHRDSMAVASASSGGVFSALAKRTLRQGGAVYGVVMEQGAVLYRGVTSEEQLPALFGSKYVFVPLAPVREEIIQRLDAQQPVLVVTSPCQAEALRRWCGDSELLTVVDFVCHGAPEPEFLRKYLSECAQEHGSPVQTVAFRKKRSGRSWEHYETEIHYADGARERMPAVDNPYMKLFVRNVSLRRACGQCVWKGEHRASDLTLGDFWGVSKVKPDCYHAAGTSLVLVNTKRGAVVWNEVQEQLVSCEVDRTAAVRYNPSAVKPAMLHPQYEQFQQDRENMTVTQLAERYARSSVSEKIKRLAKQVLRRSQ